MIASHLTPKWIFFRCTLSENLGRAPLCLRFLPRSTKKSPIWAKWALHHWFPILPRVTLNINQAAKYNGRDCFVASLLAMTTSQPSSSQAICRTSRPPYLSLRAQRGNLSKICSSPAYPPVLRFSCSILFPCLPILLFNSKISFTKLALKPLFPSALTCAFIGYSCASNYSVNRETKTNRIPLRSNSGITSRKAVAVCMRA